LAEGREAGCGIIKICGWSVSFLSLGPESQSNLRAGSPPIEVIQKRRRGKCGFFVKSYLRLLLSLLLVT